MKHILIIFALTLTLFTSCDAVLDPYIMGAEFDGNDYRMILVSYDSKFGDHTVSATVYKESGKLDRSNGIKSQEYTSSSGKTKLVLDDEVPLGGKVVIKPAASNTELSGTAEVFRKN